MNQKEMLMSDIPKVSNKNNNRMQEAILAVLNFTEDGSVKSVNLYDRVSSWHRKYFEETADNALFKGTLEKLNSEHLIYYSINKKLVVITPEGEGLLKIIRDQKAQNEKKKKKGKADARDDDELTLPDKKESEENFADHYQSSSFVFKPLNHLQNKMNTTTPTAPTALAVMQALQQQEEGISLGELRHMMCNPFTLEDNTGKLTGEGITPEAFEGVLTRMLQYSVMDIASAEPISYTTDKSGRRALDVPDAATQDRAIYVLSDAGHAVLAERAALSTQKLRRATGETYGKLAFTSLAQAPTLSVTNAHDPNSPEQREQASSVLLIKGDDLTPLTQHAKKGAIKLVALENYSGADREFMDLLKKLPSLREVRLKGCNNITGDIIEELHNQRPTLRIHIKDCPAVPGEIRCSINSFTAGLLRDRAAEIRAKSHHLSSFGQQV